MLGRADRALDFTLIRSYIAEGDMLDESVKTSIADSVVCWLATVGEGGEPNVSPKEVFTHFGDSSLIIANIASPGSVRNIEISGKACVSFINIFTQKGHKIKGNARNLRAGDSGFNERYAILTDIAGDAFPIQSVIEIEASRISEILAPRYKLYPGVTEQEQIESACEAYGVRMVGSEV